MRRRKKQGSSIIRHVHVVNAAVRILEDDLGRQTGLVRIDNADTAPRRSRLRHPQVEGHGIGTTQRITRDECNRWNRLASEFIRPGPIRTLEIRAVDVHTPRRLHLDGKPGIIAGPRSDKRERNLHHPVRLNCKVRLRDSAQLWIVQGNGQLRSYCQELCAAA